MIDVAQFHFLRPLWLLAVLPALYLWLGLRKSQQSSHQWTDQCDSHLLQHLLVRTRNTGARAPIGALLVGWIIAAIAAAGPTWTQLPQPVFRADSARIIVLDLSRSMDAGDVTPSRIARAKFKTIDLLRASRDGQTALVVFANDAYVVSPLTDDADTIMSLVPVLGTELMPSQGSRVDRALEYVIQMLSQSGTPNADVILIADGADPIEEAVTAAKTLREGGHRLSVLAVGTAQGVPIPLADGGFLKDKSGAIVIAQTDFDALSSLAADGNGIFQIVAADNSDIDGILAGLRKGPEQLREAQNNLRFADTWRDEGPWLVLALLPFAALAFRRGWIIGLLAIIVVPFPQPAMALDLSSYFQRADQRGAQAFAEERFADAAQNFEDLAWQGVAHYKAGDYAKAEAAFSADHSAQGHYNRGNALAQQNRIQDAVLAYQQALAQDPHHEDALFNKTLLEKWLEKRQNQSNDESKNGDESEQQESKNANSSSGNSRQSDTSTGERSDNEEDGSPSEDPNAGNESTGNRQRSQNPQPHRAQGDQSSPDSQDQTGPDDKQSGKDDEKLATPDSKQPQSTSLPQTSESGKESMGTDPSQRAQRDTLSQDELESKQAMEQWLRQIPDDPSRLLRNKFRRDHQTRNVPRGALDQNGKW